MRLLELHLQAFGPFTDCRLDLSSGAEGLHLIYGPNEAGKSSALRALHGLLFGIPARTRDDFIHAHRDLRIGARLRARDGRELTCYRRKGNKGTLLGADHKPIAEDSLSALLGGVDAEAFKRLFGIDHQTLVSGGEELLAERGAAADALFGAGIGALGLKAVGESLASEADEIFRARASTPTLNQALSEYRELERQLKEASLPSRQWQEADQDLVAASRELQAVEQEIIAAQSRRSLLERVRRTQPNLSRHQELTAALAALGERLVLPEDFPQRRQQAERDLHESASRRARAEALRSGLKQRRAELALEDALLGEAETIEALLEELGGYRKAAQDRPGLVAERHTLLQQAERLLDLSRPGMALERASQLRPLLTRQRRAQTLANQGSSLRAQLRLARSTQRELDRQRQEAADALQRLAPPASTQSLETAIGAARRAGDLDQSLLDTRDELAQLQAQTARALAALGLWQGDLDALCQTNWPTDAELAADAERERTLAQEEQALAQARAETQAERQRASERLQALSLAGDVPTESELTAARHHREQTWQAIKTNWLGTRAGEDASAATEPPREALKAQFEERQLSADGIADRLRREAKTVHEKASLLAHLEQQAVRTAELAQAERERSERAERFAQDWQRRWAAFGIVPRSPAEMRSWRAELGPLLDQAARRDALRLRMDSQAQRRERLIGDLAAALQSHSEPSGQAAEQPDPESAADTSLMARLEAAEACLSRLQSLAREHQALTKDHQALQQRCARQQADTTAIEQELAHWTADWTALLGELGVPPHTDAETLVEDFQRLGELFTTLDQIEALNARIAGIDRDAADFAQRVAALSARVAPDHAPPELDHHSLESTLTDLRRRLGHEREARSRHQELTNQLRAAEDDIAAAGAQQAAATATLEELCRLAGCAAADQLAAAEARAQAQTEGLRELAATEAALREAGDGHGIADLRAEAAAFDPDAVGAELNALDRRLAEELRPRERRLLERKLACEQRLAAMDGNARAAELAERIEHCRARAQRLAHQWIRLRFAARLLKDAKDAYAERHRDPLLALIAGYFERLTEGAFNAVEIDFDQGEQPILVARRANGTRLGVDALSTGTRDQLYLALRLATLSHRAANAEPLPLIVDDILVQFDDQRTRATLLTLAEFATDTQVILFTHHQYVVEQARFLQELGSPTSSDSGSIAAVGDAATHASIEVHFLNRGDGIA